MEKSSLPSARTGSVSARTGAAPARIRAGTRGRADWTDLLHDVHPHSTAKHVAARTGWPVGTVKKWLAHECEPCFEATRALGRAYGLDFLAEIWPELAGLAAAAAYAQRERLRGEIAATEAAIAAFEAGGGGAS